MNAFTLTYDKENRMVSATSGSAVESYAYDPANHRVEKKIGTTQDNVYVWGLDGRLLATYSVTGSGRFVSVDQYTVMPSLEEPASWNRYSYTSGEPVGRNGETTRTVYFTWSLEMAGVVFLGLRVPTTFVTCTRSQGLFKETLRTRAQEVAAAWIAESSPRM